MVEGMGPTSWLSFRLNETSSVRLPISGGSCPARRLLDRWTAVTRALPQLIPCQPQGVVVANQPVRFVQFMPSVLLNSATKASHSVRGMPVVVAQSNSIGAMATYSSAPMSVIAWPSSLPSSGRLSPSKSSVWCVHIRARVHSRRIRAQMVVAVRRINEAGGIADDACGCPVNPDRCLHCWCY